MKENKLITKFNRSKHISVLILVGIFLIMLYCNYVTPLVLDDFSYCFSFKDGTRITSVADIFPSMAAHRVDVNGRVIAHFFAQLFLMLPPAVFDVVNAFMFTLLVYSIYILYGLQSPSSVESTNNILLISVFCVIWVMTPEFGQVYLWLDGSVNYLWSQVFCLLWLIPYLRFFFNGSPSFVAKHPVYACFYCLFSLAVGAYSENTTVALVFMAMLFMALTLFYRKQKIPCWQIISVIMLLIGFCYMIFAPAELMVKSSDFKLSSLIDSFLHLVVSYLRFWPLIAVYILMYYFSRNSDGSKDTRICSLVFIGGSLAAHFVLTFASIQPGRCLSITLILLLCSCSVVFRDAYKSGMRPLLCTACAVCMGFSLFWGFKGISDIRRVHYMLVTNEDDILDQISQGKSKIQVLHFKADTTYSPLCNLNYLDYYPANYMNMKMADYYGVDQISSYTLD